MDSGRLLAVFAWASLVLSPLLRPVAVPEVSERAALHAAHTDAHAAAGVPCDPCESSETSSLEELDAKPVTGRTHAALSPFLTVAEAAALAEPRHRRERPLLPPPNTSASLA